jgi:hypothetical protein
MTSIIEDSFNSMYAYAHSQDLVSENVERPYIDALSLDVAPFMHTKYLGLNYHERPKEDETRMLFQALFLLVIRELIPHKCKKICMRI